MLRRLRKLGHENPLAFFIIESIIINTLQDRLDKKIKVVRITRSEYSPGEWIISFRSTYDYSLLELFLSDMIHMTDLRKTGYQGISQDIIKKRKVLC